MNMNSITTPVYTAEKVEDNFDTIIQLIFKISW